MAGTVIHCPHCRGPCRGVTNRCNLTEYLSNLANQSRHTLVPYTDQDEPTQPGFTALPFVPAAPAKCECGSGSDALSGAHSHWCRRYLAP
jgi:hypothetical protein